MAISPTPYKLLADKVLIKLKSTGYESKWTEEQIDALLYDYLPISIVKFRACKQNLSDRDDVLQQFNIELTNEEIEILANFMYIEFLNTHYINVPSLLRQSLTSKDFNIFSGRNHLDGLINLRELCNSETRQMISAYSNIGSDLFSLLNNASATVEG